MYGLFGIMSRPFNIDNQNLWNITIIGKSRLNVVSPYVTSWAILMASFILYPLGSAVSIQAAPEAAVGANPGQQKNNCANAGSITTNNSTNGHLAYYAFDNNTQTRWENSGIGSWIRYKFESNVIVTSVDILWYNTIQKSYSFRIQAADNTTKEFKTVYSGNSSIQPELTPYSYDINDTLANRIKIQVYGNNIDKNASIYEVKIHTLANNNNTATQEKTISDASTVPSANYIKPSKQLPTAEEIWKSETFYVPDNVSTFVLLIPNEGHHASLNEQMSPKNGMYLPTHTIISNNTDLVVLNNDNNHCHLAWVTRLDNERAPVAKTEFIPHAGASNQTIIRINSSGLYKISDPSEPVMQGGIMVYETDKPERAENLTVGAIYVPQKDLATFKSMFTKAGFTIESEYNFEWDNTNNTVKEHTLLVYSTSLPLDRAMARLSAIVKQTPYT